MYFKYVRTLRLATMYVSRNLYALHIYGAESKIASTNSNLPGTLEQRLI